MPISAQIRPLGRRKVGLALSGGAARGWAHIGALRALRRLGVDFDILAGCSAGALVGGCYLTQKIDELEAWALALNKRKLVRYLDLNLNRGGLIRGDRLFADLRGLLGSHRIEELRMPFVAVATDLMTGHEVWLQTGDLTDVLRASSALPGLFPPVELDKHWLADGALVDPIPVSACRALGADIVIAVNLNTDIIGKVRRSPTSASGLMGFDPAALMEESAQASTAPFADGITRGAFGHQSDKPSVFGVMTASLSIMLDRLTRARLAGDPPDVNITPRVGHIGLLEFDRAEELIREGEEAVEDKRPELMDAMQSIGFPSRLS